MPPVLSKNARRRRPQLQPLAPAAARKHCWPAQQSRPARNAQQPCLARWRGPAGGRPPDTELGLGAISAAKFHSMHRWWGINPAGQELVEGCRLPRSPPRRPPRRLPCGAREARVEPRAAVWPPRGADSATEETLIPDGPCTKPTMDVSRADDETKGHNSVVMYVLLFGRLRRWADF